MYQPSSEPHDELHSPIGPDDVYGLSKLQAERWVEHFAVRRGFSAVVARLSNVVGPGETNPHVVPEIVAQLKAGHRTIALGNLTSRRDYLDVSDAARGLATLTVAQGGLAGETKVINLGSGGTHSVSEVLDLLRKVPGVPTLRGQGDRRKDPDGRPSGAAARDRPGARAVRLGPCPRPGGDAGPHLGTARPA